MNDPVYSPALTVPHAFGGSRTSSTTSGRYRPRPDPSTSHRSRLAAEGLPAADLVAEPDQRVVLAVNHPLLHRDQRVVGDLDVLRADLGAALGDVAEAQEVLLLGDVSAFGLVQRVHVQLGHPHQEPRPGEGLLVLVVVTHDVAGVVAQEALDALAEL